MNFRAQGSLEYLLIIGGAILVSALVIMTLISAGNPTSASAKTAILDSLCARLATENACTNTAPAENCIAGDCMWKNNMCVSNPNRSENCFGGTETTGSECGNAIREGTEVCDQSSQGCTTIDGYAGYQECLPDCTGWDTCIATEYCGDNIINGPETCDGTALGEETCITQGFESGTLSCLANCTGFDISNCTSGPVCGNGICEAGENCPEDNAFCNEAAQHQICKTGSCTNGCEYTTIGAGLADTGYCDGTIGCIGGNCQCDGTGNCISANLVLWLKCQDNLSDGIATDSSLYSYNGTCSSTNCPAFVPDGGPNSTASYSFDGINDYISMGNREAFNFGTESFTWIFRTKFPDFLNSKVLAAKSNSTNLTEPGPIIYMASSGTIAFNIKDSTSHGYYIYKVTTLEDNAWHHLAFVADGRNELSMYIDGTKQSVSSSGSLSSVGSINSTVPFLLGSRSALGWYLQGEVADFKVYRAALTQEEIEQDYSQE